MMIEENITSEIYFKSIFERKNNRITFVKISAEVEKLFGKTNKQITEAGSNK